MIQDAKLDPREQHLRIPVGQEKRMLFLRYLGPAAAGAGPPRVVLYVHGATFPSALSIAHRFDGHSWRDHLNAAGFHVWGLDFLGYGGSDQYPEMTRSPEEQPALGRAEAASRQLESAVKFIVQRHSVPRISVIAHSWGTMPTGLFAGRYPDLLDRLVFFAPIARRTQTNTPRYPGWRFVSLQEQWERFIEDVPERESPVLARRHFDEWGERYLDSDPDSRRHSPAAVKVPSGPVQEIAEAWGGHLAYDPGLVNTPVSIVRGEWDHLVTDADAHWLFKALSNSPIKRDVKIGRGTHLLHLEHHRYALYQEALVFLEGADQPDADSKTEGVALRDQQFVFRS